MRATEAESGLSLKLLWGCHSSLDFLIPSPVLFLLNQHPEKTAWCSLYGINNFARKVEKWEIAVPYAWCFLPLSALINVCCPFEDALELLQGAFPNLLALDCTMAHFSKSAIPIASAYFCHYTSQQLLPPIRGSLGVRHWAESVTFTHNYPGGIVLMTSFFRWGNWSSESTRSHHLLWQTEKSITWFYSPKPTTQHLTKCIIHICLGPKLLHWTASSLRAESGSYFSLASTTFPGIKVAFTK